MKTKNSTLVCSKFSLKPTGISVDRAHHSPSPISNLSAPCGECFNNLITPVGIMAKNSSETTGTIPESIHTPITSIISSPPIPSLPTITIPQSYFQFMR